MKSSLSRSKAGCHVRFDLTIVELGPFSCHVPKLAVSTNISQRAWLLMSNQTRRRCFKFNGCKDEFDRPRSIEGTLHKTNSWLKQIAQPLLDVDRIATRRLKNGNAAYCFSFIPDAKL
jgi:hypothetical protein